jgi:hypothetical protein
LVVADIAVAVQDAVVLEAREAREPLYSLTPLEAVVVVAATVQTSAGIVTVDILVATVAADLQVLTIVLHTELVEEEVQVLLYKVTTVLAEAHTTDTLLELEGSTVLTVNAVDLVNHGLTETVTVITAEEVMVAVVAVAAHHMAAAGAAKVLYALSGLQPELILTHRHNCKYRNGVMNETLYIY